MIEGVRVRLQRGLKFKIGMYREFFFNLPKNHLDRKAVTSMEHRQDMQEV